MLKMDLKVTKNDMYVSLKYTCRICIAKSQKLANTYVYRITQTKLSVFVNRASFRVNVEPTQSFVSWA
jgi:hypothetical protein